MKRFVQTTETEWMHELYFIHENVRYNQITDYILPIILVYVDCRYIKVSEIITQWEN